MSSVNKVIIVGRLGNDPEVRQFSNGGGVTNISVATSEKWNDKQTGEKKEQTEWHRISLFNRLGEIAAQYLRKGSMVYIEGSLHTRKYTDQQGVEKYSTEIRANEMRMLGGGSNDGNQGYNNFGNNNFNNQNFAQNDYNQGNQAYPHQGNQYDNPYQGGYQANQVNQGYQNLPNSRQNQANQAPAAHQVTPNPDYGSGNPPQGGHSPKPSYPQGTNQKGSSQNSFGNPDDTAYNPAAAIKPSSNINDDDMPF